MFNKIDLLDKAISEVPAKIASLTEEHEVAQANLRKYWAQIDKRNWSEAELDAAADERMKTYDSLRKKYHSMIRDVRNAEEWAKQELSILRGLKILGHDGLK